MLVGEVKPGSHDFAGWRGLVWVLMGLGLADLGARPVPVPFNSEYLVEHLGLEDGFPENSCSGIAPAPDGALWFGTFRGLVRFNGREFKAWGPPGMPELARTGIIAMFHDSRRRVWFSTDEGLVENDQRAWRKWTEAQGWKEPRDFVRSWAEAADGRLAFGRFGGGIMLLENGRWRELPALPGQGGAWCAFDGNGVLHGARSGFVGVLAGDRWQPVGGDKAGLGPVLGLGQRRDGAVCAFTAEGRWDLRGGAVVGRQVLSGPITAFWRVTEDREGRWWAAALADGLYRISPDGTVRHLRRADGLAGSGGTRIVYADEHDAIWVGTGVGAVTRLRPPRFRLLGEAEGFGDRVSLTVAPLPGGRVLLSTYGTGPLEFDGRASARPVETGDLQVRSLLRGADGTIWLGTFGRGLWTRDASGLRQEPSAGFAADETIMTLFEDSRHRVWAAGERTVVGRDGPGFRPVLLPDTGARNRATFFAERRDGTIVLARRHEVYQWRSADRPAELTCVLPAGHRISTVLVDRADRLWIGTLSHGLHVWHDGRLARLGPEQGLPDASIASLIEDDAGQLWFGSGRSLVRLDPAAAQRTALSPGQVLAFQRFDQSDGLRNLEFPGSFQPSVAKDEHGRLWFAQTRGAGMVDPASVGPARGPLPVMIETLSYLPPGEREAKVLTIADGDRDPVLPAGSRLIRISYAALDLQGPGKNRFRVRLGSKGQWQEMHQEATVSFLELPPGRQELRVQASGSDGVWSRTEGLLRFTIEPHVWQTAWFRVGVALTAAGLVGAGAWLAAQRRVREERERLARERRLAAAQERLALVLENTSDLVLFAGPGGEVLFLNPAGWTLLGLTPGESPGALGVALGSLVRRLRDEVGLEGRPAAWNGDSTVRHVSGREIPVSVVAGAHRQPSGALEFVSAIARDISATRDQAERQDALRELAAGLNAARDAADMGRTIAAACRRLFNHEALCLVVVDEATGREESVYVEDTVDGDSGPSLRAGSHFCQSAVVQRALAGETLLINHEPPAPEAGFRLNSEADSERRRPASQVIVPVWWTGKAIGVLAVQSYRPQCYRPEDVPHLQAVALHCGAAIRRIHAEEELRANEARLRLAMQAVRMGSWEAEIPSGRLTVSAEAAAVYGWHPSAVGEGIDRLVHGVPEPEATALREELAAMLRGERESCTLVHRIRADGGGLRWLELNAQRQPSVGPAARVIGVTADVTARKHAEQERLAMAEQLRQAQKLEAIGTLAGGIAHDFNNILTAILGNAELAQMMPAPGREDDHHLEQIRLSALRARDLVRRILAFSQPREISRRPVALRPLVEETRDLLRATLPATIHLEVVVPESLPLVAADGTEFHQVLLNLATNARQALGNRSGRIGIRLETCTIAAGSGQPHPDLQPGLYVHLAVKDDGPGIAPEVLPRIFDPFFTTKAPGEGSGLGLSVVHGIMRACGGGISVESELGRGACFHLYLPALAEGALPPEPASANQSPPLGRPISSDGHVLAVDDESTLISVLERFLQMAGYTVTGCTDPLEAWKLFQAEPGRFDALVTDFAMPHMTGIELAQRLRTLRPELPVILTSGYLREEDLAAARTAGINHCLEKPGEYGRIVPALQELLSVRG
jgi:PAS domain S-box-containing protein